MTLFLFLAACHVSARDDGEFMKAVLELAGCLSVEELDEDEVERYSDLHDNPLPLNYASRSKLLSSGLMSAYQVAVLMGHREMTGDILSYEELSALDGFGVSFVSALRSFVSLESTSPPGHSSSPPLLIRNAMTLKSGMRNAGTEFSPEGMYAAKYRISAGECVDAGISMRSSWQDSHFPPEKYSFFLACYGRKFPGKLVLGDFSLRFGQGLALWSGFSMSGISAPDAFSRRPAGVVPYHSYSGDGAFRGLAADFGRRHFNASVFAAGLGLREMMEGGTDFSRDILYGFNAGWYGMSGQVSATCFAVSPAVIDVPSGMEDLRLPVSEYFTAAIFSCDARFSVRGTYLFGEVSYDIYQDAPAALAGVRTDVSDGVKLALMARYYPPEYSGLYSGAARSGSKCSNEHGISMALSHSSGNWVDIAGKTGFGSSEKRFQGVFSADASYSPEPKYGTDTSSCQMKVMLTENVRISRFFSASFRISERYRTYAQPFRTDVRTDLRCGFSRLNINFRINLLHCEGTSFLSYLEGGWRLPAMTVWLRAGVFRADNWDDRIYAYERDAPGSFSVPAYYGRGYWTALTGGWRLSRGIKLYFRASFQDYPWLSPAETEKKPAKAEIRLQLAVDLRHAPYLRNS